MSQKVRKAVIPAAGLGTRFLPATKVIPKELLPIAEKPGIQYIVEEAIDAGVEEIIFVISADKTQVVNHFKPLPELEAHLKIKNKLSYLEEITKLNNKAKYTVVYQEKPLGLGHAVLCAQQAVGNEWFFVFLPDDLIDHEILCAKQMLHTWENHNGGIIAVMEVLWEHVQQYGVVKAHPISARVGKIENVVEKPKREEAPSNLAIVGRYLLPPTIFPHLSRVKPGAVGEIQLTDALLSLIKDQDLYAFQFEGERFDIGDKVGFLEANINYILKDPASRSRIIEFIKIIAESR